MTETVAVVGFGQMGTVMANQLAGMYDVVVYDRDVRRLEAAQKQYATAHLDALSAEVVLLALPGPAEVRAVIPHVLQSGILVVDTTSIDPETAILAERMVRAGGGRYVEAPVLGGPPQAGAWVFLAGGDGDDVVQAARIVDPMGRVVHFGPVGAGSRAKLLNNMLTGINAAAVAEVLTLARRLQVDLGKLYDAITNSGSAGKNAVWEIRVPKILAGTLEDTFSIDLMKKDLVLAQAMADAAGVSIPLTVQSLTLYDMVAGRGFGARDIGRLADAFESSGQQSG